MIDKYKEINIFEIENGWIIKILYPEKKTEINQIAYTSLYFKTLKEVAGYIKELP